jgi:hypothetical protein
MKLVKKSIPITPAQILKMQMMTANIDLNNSDHKSTSTPSTSGIQQQHEEEINGGCGGDDASTNEIQHTNEKSEVEQHSPAPAGDSGYRSFARRLSC